MTTLQPSWEGETVEIVESQPTGDPTYDAFISYSHTADRKLAPALRDGLHRFAKPWYRRRAMRVFQDTSNLESSPDLWATIQAALRGSRALVLLASGSSAMSQWVAREIQTWRLANRMPDGSLQPDRPILIVLTDGEIVWDHAAGDFDWTRTTALPRALSGVFRAEPLWLDLRWAHTEEQLSLRDPRFRDAIASLVAAIRHQSKDDLIGEDVRVWRRNRRVAWAAASLLMVLTLVAGGLGYAANVARQDAVDKNTALQQALRESKANELVLRSVQARDTDPELALRLGAAALAINPVETNRRELETTLLGTRFDGSSLVRDPDAEFFTKEAALIARGGTLVVDGTWPIDATVHDLTVWDTTDPRNPVRVGTVPSTPNAPTVLRLSLDGTLLASSDGDTLDPEDVSTIVLASMADPAHADIAGSIEDLPGLKDFALSPDHTLLAAIGDPDPFIIARGPIENHSWLRLWDISDPAAPVLVSEQTGVYDRSGVAFAGNGRTLVVAGAVGTYFYDDAGNFVPEKSTPTGATLWDISDPTEPVRNPKRLLLSNGHVAASAAGTLVALPSSGNDVVALYDVSDPMKPVTLGEVPTQLRARDVGLGVAVSPNGRLLVATGEDATSEISVLTARVWDITDPSHPVALAELSGGERGVLATGFSEDGTALTTVDTDLMLARWRVNDRGIHKLAAPDVIVEGGGLDGGDTASIVSAVAVSPVGGLVGTVGVLGEEVRLWDVTDPTRPVEVSRFAEHVESLAFGPEGDLMATGSRTFGADGDEVTLWDISDPADPTALATMRTPHEVVSVAFHPHQPMLTATAWPESPQPAWVGIWDITDPTAPRALDLPADDMYSQFQNVFSPDGSLLALGHRLWDVSSPGKAVPIETGLTGDDSYLLPAIGPVAFNADSTRIVTESVSQLTMWDISDLSAPRQLWSADLGVSSAEWFLTPDLRVLIGATNDGALSVWDVSGDTPLPVLSFQAQNYGFSGLALSPDGTWFTSAGDAVMPVWSLGEVPAIIADPAGQACAVAGPLTPEEWDQYVSIYPYEDLCA